MRSQRFTSAIVLLLAVCFTGLVLPQRTANILGVVQDQSGGVLPGVEVTVLNLDTGITSDLVTDDEGRYQVRNLQLGNYQVEASLTGFQTSVRSGILLTVGRAAVVNFTLQVGEVTELVTVTGDVPLINTTSGELSSLVDERAIRDLPLNGRSFSQLATLSPGVINFRLRSGEAITVAGARPTQNNWVIDGTSIVGQNRSTPGGGRNLGVEAIREFEVLTSTYSAEFGGAAGGTINVVSRSGSNQLHGSIYEFHKNDNLNARDTFAQTKGEFKFNQFGFTLGGPIVKNRTFFFFNYEGIRRRDAAPSNVNVPTQLARQGILPKPSGGSCPPGFPENPSGDCVGVPSPLTAPYIALYPLPNGRDFGDGTALFSSNPADEDDANYYNVRFDHEFSDSDSMFVRYAITDGNKFEPDDFLLFSGAEEERLQYVSVTEKKIFSPVVLNTLSFTFHREFDTRRAKDLAGVDPALSFVPGQPFGNLSFGQSNIAGDLANISRTSQRFDIFNMSQLSDDVNYTRGAHSVQFGGSIGWIQHNWTNPRAERGIYQLTGLEDFLLNEDATSFTVFSPDSIIFRGMRIKTFGLYVQDDFAVRPNLTLNLGVRYQTQTTPREVNDLESQLVNLLDPAVVEGEPYFNHPGHAFEPRLGFAWDPFGSGETSIRGGFGVFHDFVLGSVYRNVALNDPLFSKVVSLTPAPFPNAYDIIFQADDPPLSTLSSVDPDVKMSSRMQWNLNVQHQILDSTVVQVSYVGAAGRHGSRVFEGNIAVPDILADGRKFWPDERDANGVACDPDGPSIDPTCDDIERRNPNFASINQIRKDANSSYNALQMQVTRRFDQGFRFQGSYTWSHSIDDSSQRLSSQGRNSPGRSVDLDDRKFDRGSSVFDIRHNLTLNGTYDLPFMRSQSTGLEKLLGGWQLNGLLQLSSGNPLTAVLGDNVSRNFDLSRPERPDLGAGNDNNPFIGERDQWFDPLAFELPEAGFFGNVGRTTMQGPGYASFDFGLVKKTQVTENVELQFRFEAFNALNKANYGRIRNVIFRSRGRRRGDAGEVRETAAEARQFQFALKIIF